MQEKIIPKYTFHFNDFENKTSTFWKDLILKIKTSKQKQDEINVYTSQQIYDMIYDSLWDDGENMLLDNDVDRATEMANDIMSEGQFGDYYQLNEKYWVDNADVLEDKQFKNKLLHILSTVITTNQKPLKKQGGR